MNLSFDLKHILCIEYFKILYSYIGTDTIIMVLLNWNIWVSMLDFPSSMELSRGSLLTSKGKTCFILLIYTQLLNSSLAIKCATFKVIRIKSFFPLPNHTSTKSTLVQAMFNACSMFHWIAFSARFVFCGHSWASEYFCKAID